MARYEEAEPILKAATRWKDECLLDDGSIFTDRRLWTAENVGHLQRYYVDNLDAGEGGFWTRLESQLEAAPPQAKQFAAEMLWVMYLMVTQAISPDTKRKQIRKIWEWSGEPLPEDRWALGDVLAGGVAHPGPGFNQHRWRELRFFITAMGDWKRLGQDKREALLTDPWEFARWLEEREWAAGRQLPHMLRFLLFPETFERIATAKDKEQIVHSFRSEWDKDPEDFPYDDLVALDREVLRIRERLEEEYGDEEIDFYRPPVTEAWRSDDSDVSLDLDLDALQSLRETFLRRHPVFESFRTEQGLYWHWERGYKEELKRAFEETVVPKVEAPREQEGWSEALREAVYDLLTRPLEMSDGQPQNLVSWRYYVFLGDLDEGETDRFADAFVDLLKGEGGSGERVERFNDEMLPVLERHDAGNDAVTRSFPTLFLMLNDPEREIFIRTRLFNRLGKRLIGERLFENRPLGAEGHERALDLARAIREELESWGWEPRDMIDVQSFMWAGGTEDSDKDSHAHWIFQCNPDYFDLEGYARSRDRITLLVNQHADDIELGDRVYLWEAGEDAGILGRAWVIDAPRKRPGDEAGAEFDRGEPDRFHGEKTRARLYVEEVLDERVSRGRLRDDPALEDLSILKFPQGTNFPVSEAEAEVLDAYIRGEEPPSTRKGDPVGPTGDVGFDELLEDLERKGFHFPPETVANYLLALQTKGFVILTGISGTGKTLLAIETAKHFRPRVGPDRGGVDHYEVVDVRPDWTDNRGLLGYYNPITESYRPTPFLNLLLRAAGEEERAETEGRQPDPFFVILDEMNLARVEHYFSDFLSALESEEPIHLHDDPILEAGDSEGDRPIPRTLEIPENVFFTGTVNVDETTYMFSPKVLDRAFTLELNRVDLRGYGESSSFASAPGSLSMDELETPLACDRRPNTEDWRRFGDLRDGEFQRSVVRLNERLAEDNLHFGYRVANEIARFVLLATSQSDDGETAARAALDLAVMQKVLPKFHGTEQELGSVLRQLFGFAVTGEPGASAGGPGDDPLERDWRIRNGRLRPAGGDETAEDVQNPLLPRTAAKLWRMLRRLRDQGFTSFIQ